MIDIYTLLKKHEGFRAFPYRCTSNKRTIGYGRNLEDRGITETEADFLLKNDVAWFRKQLLLKDWFENLNPCRQDVVLNMAFNLGIQGILGFHKMIIALELEDYAVAAAEMLDSRWARQVKSRALELAHYMKEGNYKNEFCAQKASNKRPT